VSPAEHPAAFGAFVAGVLADDDELREQRADLNEVVGAGSSALC